MTRTTTRVPRNHPERTIITPRLCRYVRNRTRRTGQSCRVSQRHTTPGGNDVFPGGPYERAVIIDADGTQRRIWYNALHGHWMVA